MDVLVPENLGSIRALRLLVKVGAGATGSRPDEACVARIAMDHGGEGVTPEPTLVLSSWRTRTGIRGGI